MDGQQDSQDNDCTAELAQEIIGQEGTLKGRIYSISRLPVAMLLLSFILGVGIVQLSFQLCNSIYRSYTWSSETQKTLDRVANLRRDVKILKDTTKAATENSYLEELARCQGFVYKNESVVVSTIAPSTPPGYNCTPVRLP